MVYYVVDELDKDWSVATRIKPRDLYEMEQDDDVVYDVEPSEPQRLEMLFPNDESNINLARLCSFYLCITFILLLYFLLLLYCRYC